MADQRVFVEIVAKAKGCMLCDLALAILEETAVDLPEGVLNWQVVDVGSRSGLDRFSELARLCGRETGRAVHRDRPTNRL